MISVEEARDRILGLVGILPAEEKPILDALDQVLAEDVYASFDIPPLPNSAMDGYAVQWESVRGASSQTPRRLHVIGSLAAGYLATEPVTADSAYRIMTGAPLPSGADTVVPFEDTDEEQQRSADRNRLIAEIAILVEPRLNDNVRPAGEDIRRGQLVVPRGAVLRPAEIGVLASLGRATVSVIRRPIVAMLATGDELVGIGEPLLPGKIYDANSYSVAALIKRYGGIPKLLGIARDNIADLKEKIHQGLDADMLLTSAGVSTGDYDIVKEVLAAEGQIDFWLVRMKPGKPLAFGLFRRQDDGVMRVVPHLGLPGNPVSSMVTFELFARPALLKMMGKTNYDKPVIEAVLEGGAIRNSDGRRQYYRVAVRQDDGVFRARITGDQGSGILSSMAAANGLAIGPEDQARVPEGETVEVVMLDWVQEL